MIKLIAFLGEKENGKTTACDIFEMLYEQNTEHKVIRLSVKQPIVDELKRNFPELLSGLSVLENTEIDDLFHVKPPFIRALMRDYGQAKRKECGDNYWADQYARALVNVPDDSVVLTDDIRFPEELDKVLEVGGQVYNVIRIGKEQGQDTHPTERALDKVKLLFKKIEAGEGELEEIITKIFYE